jgi:cytochrome c2
MTLVSPLIFLLFQLTTENPLPTKEEDQINPIYQTGQVENGLTLLQKHCYACHNPNSDSHDDILAPPLAGVKKHYAKAYPEKEQFSKAMIEFVKNPTVEKSLMKGPVKRFGLMPKPTATDQEIQQIVRYIRDVEIARPRWFDEHGKGHGK